MGVYLVLLTIANIVALVQIVWVESPSGEADESQKANGNKVTYSNFLIGSNLHIDKNLHFLLIAVFGGSLGALVDGVVTLVKPAKEDNQDNQDDKLGWHITRPFIGAALGMATYFAFRGGLLTNSEVDLLNPYAIATVAIVVGLAADEAYAKLKKIFTAVFGEK